LQFVYCVLPNLKTNTAFCLGGTLPNSFLDCILSQDLTAFCPRLFIAFCLQQNCVLSKALHCDLLPAFCLLLKTFIAFCPFELGTTRDTLGTTPEGGVLLGPERHRTYDDLNDDDKKRFDADVRATNIVLQGLPKVY
ncbi:hypothetical protein Tco_0603403, partial [Tanacetum coccineum]